MREPARSRLLVELDDCRLARPDRLSAAVADDRRFENELPALHFAAPGFSASTNADHESGSSVGSPKRFLAMQAGEPLVRRMRSPPSAPTGAALPVVESTRMRRDAKRTASTHSHTSEHAFLWSRGVYLSRRPRVPDPRSVRPPHGR